MASHNISDTNDICTIQITKDLYLAFHSAIIFADSMADKHEQDKAVPSMAVLWYEKHAPLLDQALKMIGKKIA